MNSYLHCSGFFLIKSENSLIHGLFHNCSFMHKLLIIAPQAVGQGAPQAINACMYVCHAGSCKGAEHMSACG